MTPESWSVEEVVMHLAIAEPQYWDQFKESLKKPANADFKPQATDAADVVVRHRSHPTHDDRRGARAAAVSFRTPKASLASFKQAADAKMMKYGEGLAGGPARAAVPRRQAMDLYQWFLMISTHSQRHILQIREIKAHKEFPKK